jgi:hypothetical protein
MLGMQAKDASAKEDFADAKSHCGKIVGPPYDVPNLERMP